MPSYRGELRLPNKHAIAASHQAADSNAALPRRGRGAVRGEAWRGDDVASALARGHGLLGSGGGGIGDGVDADLVRKLLRGPCVARVAPGSWVRLRAAAAASTTSCSARLSAQRQREQSLKRCFACCGTTGLLVHCLLSARAGLPWHPTQSARCPSRFCSPAQLTVNILALTYLRTPYRVIIAELRPCEHLLYSTSTICGCGGWRRGPSAAFALPVAESYFWFAATRRRALKRGARIF